MKSRYVFSGIIVIALILVTIGLVQVVSADYRTSTTKTWVGVDGNWETAANWNPSGVPDVGDDVTINGGSVTISSAQSITSLTFNGGTLTGAGNLVISGLFTWSGGTMSGAGSTTANGGISITGTDSKSLWQRTLNNNGTCNYAGSGFGLYLSTFNNQAGGTFNLPTDNPILSIVGGTINNYGTLNRTTSSGTATIQVVFNNSGTVNVQSGTLRLASTGTHTGLFDVAAGATLSFPTGGGNHQLNAGSNVSGAGTVDVSGANVTIGGSYDLTGPTNISAGALIIDSNITTPTALNLSSGYLEGNGNVTMTGLFTWSGGTMRGTGTTTANGGISITGTDSKSLWQRTLNNNGTCNYAGSGFGLYLSTLNNQTGATFNQPTDNPILSIVGGTINNYGTINRTTSSGTATIQVVFNNSGTVSVQSGTLQLTNSGTHTGLFDVAAGATLSFPTAGGNHQLNAGSNVSGAGTVDVSGANVTIAGSYDLTGPTNVSGGTLAIDSNITTPTTLNFNSGYVEGSGNVTMTGLFTWSGGTMRGTGTTTANGGISIASDVAKSLWQRTLNNNGTCNYDGSGFGLYLSTFNNQTGATFNLPTDNPILSIVGGTINNYGTINRTTSSGTATIQVVFNNYGTVNIQSGTLNFGNTYTQTAGSTVLNGGSVSTSNPLDIQGGTLEGSGNIAGNVSIGASGAVDIELGGTTPGTGASNYDQLNIGGSATLSGTLNVSLAGGFLPAVGDTFTVMTFGSRTGTFASANLAAPGGGRAWDAVAYNPASVVLNVIVGTNQAPVAPTGSVSYRVDEGGVLNQAAPGVLGDVTDADGDPLTATLVSDVSHGTLVLNADGSFTYTPTEGFTGTDSFTCKANDGSADSSVFTVSIEVTQGGPPTIASLSKSSSRQGKKLTVVITGTNLLEFTDLDFGVGIKVISIRAESSTRMTADIAIDSDAALGARDVVVTTPEGAFTLEDGFTVEKAKSGGVPVWVWPVVVVAVLAAGAGGFFFLFLLPRRRAKQS